MLGNTVITFSIRLVNCKKECNCYIGRVLIYTIIIAFDKKINHIKLIFFLSFNVSSKLNVIVIVVNKIILKNKNKKI